MRRLTWPQKQGRLLTLFYQEMQRDPDLRDKFIAKGKLDKRSLAEKEENYQSNADVPEFRDNVQYSAWRFGIPVEVVRDWRRTYMAKDLSDAEWERCKDSQETVSLSFSVPADIVV